LSTGDGSKTVYLWIADANNNVNTGPVSANITVDTVAPAVPTVQLSDATTSSTSNAYTTPANISITSDTGAVKWCSIEQAAAASAPSAPLYNDACWVGTRPTTQALAATGNRKVYVYTMDVADNVSTSAATSTITY